VENKAHIDFETRSIADLKKVGAHKYAEHPLTDIMCLGIGWNDEPAVVMGVALKHSDFNRDRGDASHADFIRLLEHIKYGGLVVAHNAAFELAIWNNVGIRKYGWPELKCEQMDCTMARAYAMALPGALDGARAAVGLDVQKDLAGGRLMMKMCQPKAEYDCPMCTDYDADCKECFGIGKTYTWHEEPDQITRLFDYCRQDIIVERVLDERLMKLSPREKRVWCIDQKINTRGVLVDVKTAKHAAAIVELEADRLDAEMRRVTEQGVATCNAHVQLKKWIVSEGIPTKSVGKNAIADLLSNPELPAKIRTAIGIRKEAAKSSTAKLTRMVEQASATDQRLRGMLQYHGANTGRWAARGVQIHNLPRPHLEQHEIESVFKALTEYTDVEEARDFIELFHGKPMEVIADCLRGFLIAPPGKKLVAVDWSAIEARITSWLAGETYMLNVFRTHGKAYEAQAAKTYMVAIEAITKHDPRRQVGKVQILALGFGGGVGALQNMCAAYGIKLEPTYDDLWRLASPDRRDRVLKRYHEEYSKAKRQVERLGIEPPLILTISQKEWIASDLIKLAYRDANQNTVAFWWHIENAAIEAVVTRRVTQVDNDGPPIRFAMKGSFLLCQLPSGRLLTYPYPEIREVKTSWGEYKQTLTYKSEDSTTRKWVRGQTYGGSLTENVVQATARDLLADTLIRVERAGYKVVMHIHDEFVAEVDKSVNALPKLLGLACALPEWARDLPIAAEGWEGGRYRK
jgi:DNA polymerase